jgi:two-component system phosphate regulon response regulator PhoB
MSHQGRAELRTEIVINKQIMVVDDSKVILELIEVMLKKSEFVVHKAHGGAEAQRLLLQSVPDLFLMDYRMPGMSGLELCQYIRAHPVTCQTPFILMTAERCDPAFIQLCIEAGVSDCIRKPFTTGQLVTKIKTHLTYNIVGNYKEKSP